MNNAKTQRQIAQDKNSQATEEYVTVKNVSRQMIPISLKAPKGIDFLAGFQTIYLHPNKSEKLPKSRLMWEEQITNLQKKGIIKIIS